LGTSSSSGERLLVGAAVLTLLSELAQDGPVLCLIDDVHWFDRSSVDALLLAVRRLHADPVAMIIAAPAVLLLAAVAWSLPHPATLIRTPTDPQWTATHYRWAAVLATALAAFLWASHERNQRRVPSMVRAPTAACRSS
jgi:hypothetical protein